MLSNGGPRMPEYRPLGTGALNFTTGVNGNGGGAAPLGLPRFEGPRSPPGPPPPPSKNTRHVPCKFFRQGQCQAGDQCPFSHESTAENVCKYFSKGNCKFGPKCANIHVLPDGRRVNYKGGPLGMGAGHLNIGGRLNTDLYHSQPGGSALTNSFRANPLASGPPYTQPYVPRTNLEEGIAGMIGRAHIDINVPMIDTSSPSQHGSTYGSPRDEDPNRLGLGLSPGGGRRSSILDAPLPASFDSNGTSFYARGHPVASSVPSKFGLESPIGSITSAKEGIGSEALRSLHSSAFGDDTKDRFNSIASSPPVPTLDEYYGKRTMHSHRLAKTKFMSSSMPKAVDRDWDASFTFEEDCIPGALDDLLTPQEKARRGSRNADDEGRPVLSGTGTPIDTPSKFGSPSNASPSRWGPIFTRHNKDEETSRASAFGHVGSPLRNSTLHPGASPKSGPISRPISSFDAPLSLASPTRQSPMSIISQQLQKTRLSQSSSGEANNLHLGVASRAVSSPMGAGRSSLTAERQLSSGSMGTGGSGRFTTPIDEEQGDFVFSMEGMEDLDDRKEKRNSGPWSFTSSSRSPHLAARNGVSSTSSNGSLHGNPSGMFQDR